MATPNQRPQSAGGLIRTFFGGDNEPDEQQLQKPTFKQQAIQQREEQWLAYHRIVGRRVVTEHAMYETADLHHLREGLARADLGLNLALAEFEVIFVEQAKRDIAQMHDPLGWLR